MICPNCKKQTPDKQKTCVYCNANLDRDKGQIGIYLYILFFVMPIFGLIMYLVWMGYKPRSAKKAIKVALIGFVVFLFVSVLLAAPIYKRYTEKKISYEVQEAISGIRKAYDVQRQTEGTTEGYTINEALAKASISSEVLTNWRFEVIGTPPSKYIARSVNQSTMKSKKVVWYDTNDARYHGFGVDGLTEP